MADLTRVSGEVLRGLEEVVTNAGQLPAPVRSSPTVLQILGVDDRETRISRLLQFFLDSTEVHNLGDTVLRALIGLLEDGAPSDDEFIEVERVEREETVQGGGRIDLVVYADQLVCCIENKLFADVSNDLLSYQSYVENQAEERNDYYVLLSLYDADDLSLGPAVRLPETRFQLVTYEQLFQAIELELGSRAVEADRYYLGFLLDFMESTRALTESKMKIDSEFLEFVTEQREQLTDLIDRTETLKKEMRRRVPSVRDHVDEDWKGEPHGLRSDVFRETPFEFFDSALFLDLELTEGVVIDLGVRLTTRGWRFRVRSKGANLQETREHLSSLGLNVTSHPQETNRLLIEEESFEFGGPTREVATFTGDLLEQLLDSESG